MSYRHGKKLRKWKKLMAIQRVNSDGKNIVINVSIVTMILIE